VQRSRDDWPAINAVQSLSIAGGFETAGAPPMGSATVELPQGHCLISQPIKIFNFGSIQGSGNGTWLQPFGSWSGISAPDNAMIEIVQSYGQTKAPSMRNRFVKDISFIYGDSASPAAVVAIKVYQPDWLYERLSAPCQRSKPPG
jgi:hypothetical protein